MLRRILRVLVGFVLACLAAAATTVAFADIQELKQLTADDAQVLLATTGERILFAAFQGAVFAAPIALIGIMIGEWRRIQSWTYYTLLALAITFLGFLAWSSGEAAGDPTIINNYAMTAFLATGFVGGVIYWLFSGRNAGRPYSRSSYDFVKTSADSARARGGAASPKKAAEPVQAVKTAAKPAAKEAVAADVPAKGAPAAEDRSAAKDMAPAKSLAPAKDRAPTKEPLSLQEQLRDQMATPPKPAPAKPATPKPELSEQMPAKPTPAGSGTTAGEAAAKAARAAKAATEPAAKKVEAALDPKVRPGTTKSATSVPETAPNTKKS